MRFWDTSALFPLLTVQPGSSSTAAVVGSDPEIALWSGTPVELASAAARLHRMGEVDAERLRAAADKEGFDVLG